MKVEIVTPQGRAFAGEAAQVTAPGVMGEFGILPGHIPFLAAVRSGVLRLGQGEGEQPFAIGPGFVQVGYGDKVIVLTDLCLTPEQIDLAAAQRELEEATAQLAKWDRELDADWLELEARRAWADARVETRTGEYRNGGIGARTSPNLPESPPNPAF
ncbi:MAG TPA: ATP synthase F1 subunit epsilon [Polyangia bacterium]|nr:ATP synthase F1 subunit epsilon [Polyangia bacterium]